MDSESALIIALVLLGSSLFSVSVEVVRRRRARSSSELRDRLDRLGAQPFLSPGISTGEAVIGLRQLAGAAERARLRCFDTLARAEKCDRALSLAEYTDLLSDQRFLAVATPPMLGRVRLFGHDLMLPSGPGQSLPSPRSNCRNCGAPPTSFSARACEYCGSLF